MSLKRSRYLLLILTLLLNIGFSGAADVRAQAKKVSEKAAASPERFALVIGNSSYPERLPNPVNDASLIAKSLRLTGFKITEKKDLSLAEMRQAVEDFSQSLPQGAVGLFYFAGHGLQVSGKNFLLPVDFKEVDTEQGLLATQLDLDSIISALSKKSGLTIVILDVCRNNNLRLALSFATEQGFAVPKQNPGGIYIAYSTSPGTLANDGADGNSPYSKALSKNLLLSPGRLEDVFIKTRIEVRNATANSSGTEQIPWESGSLSTLFYFTSDKSKKSAAVSIPSPGIRATSAKPTLPFGIKGLSNFSFVVPRVGPDGWTIGQGNKTGKYFIETAGSATLEMVEVPGGNFQMGSDFKEVEKAYQEALKSNDKADREVITAEMPKHSVSLPGFFMSKYEITQGQWSAVMGGLPEIAQELRGKDRPVVNITWKEAKKFCEILSLKSKRAYRLPSEAEWEYAARAETDTPFAFGENINSTYVNFFALAPYDDGIKGEFRERTTATGEIEAANNFGLFNMHGNVWEWCEDYWHWDYNGAPNNGSAWRVPAQKASDDSEDPAFYRVIRGGSFESIGNNCRSAYRRARPAVDDFHYPDLGFRIVYSN